MLFSVYRGETVACKEDAKLSSLEQDINIPVLQVYHCSTNDQAAWTNHQHHHHHHLYLNREGHWGTTDDFTTSFLHSVSSILPSFPLPSETL